MTVRETGARTGGRFAVVEYTLLPGGWLVPHTHANEDECTYVLDGELGVQLEGEEIRASAGSLIYKPRGIEHAFWNDGHAPVRWLDIVTPAGFARFFQEAGTLARIDHGEPDEALARMAERYGVVFAFHRTAELVRRYGLGDI